MLSGQDMRDVLRLGETVLSCQATDELRHAALDVLQPIYRCDSANFFLARPSDGRLDLDSVVTRSITGENLIRFRDYYCRLDPFLKFFPPPAPVLTMEDVTSPRKLVHGEYYNDFLNPQAIHHQMTITARSGRRVLGVVALFRPAHLNNFSKVDRTKARMIANYLSGALEKTLYSDQCLRQQRALETIAGQLPYDGLLVLDEKLSPVFMSSGMDKRGEMAGEIRQAGLELLEEVRRGKRRPAVRTLTGPKDEKTGQASAVEVRVVTEASPSPLIVVGLVSDRSGRDWSGRLKNKGISRREVEVVGLVYQGLTNTEVARELFISEYTVENHLKSIYRKLGVKNRTSLIRTLVDLPAPVRSEFRE